LARQRVLPLPALRTSNRILQRHGAFDGQHRIRRPPPPPGWYLPNLAALPGVWSWTAGTPSKDWSSRGARTSKSSTVSRCMVAW
jgi:hypothetical protein